MKALHNLLSIIITIVIIYFGYIFCRDNLKQIKIDEISIFMMIKSLINGEDSEKLLGYNNKINHYNSIESNYINNLFQIRSRKAESNNAIKVSCHDKIVLSYNIYSQLGTLIESKTEYQYQIGYHPIMALNNIVIDMEENEQRSAIISKEYGFTEGKFSNQPILITYTLNNILNRNNIKSIYTQGSDIDIFNYRLCGKEYVFNIEFRDEDQILFKKTLTDTLGGDKIGFLSKYLMDNYKNKEIKLELREIKNIFPEILHYNFPQNKLITLKINT